MPWVSICGSQNWCRAVLSSMRWPTRNPVQSRSGPACLARAAPGCLLHRRELSRAVPALARRAVGGRAAQGCRALAPARPAGFPRQSEGRHGVGHAPPAGGDGRGRHPESDAFGANPCTTDGHRLRQALQVRNRADRGDRERRTLACGGARNHRRLPDHDPQEGSRSRSVAGTRELTPRGCVRPWRAKGSGRRRRGHNVSPSNGQTQGQITKLKLVRRQMYGRGKLDLLEARLVAPA